MIHRLKFFFFGCSIFMGMMRISAQESPDVAPIGNDSTLRILQSPLLENRYDLVKTESVLLLDQAIGRRISVTTLNMLSNSGKLRPYQEAEKLTNATFQAEGGRKLRQLLLWGSFSYSNSSLDSVRWGHRKDADFSTPFYYGSQRAVHYQQTDYAVRTHLKHTIYRSWEGSLSGDYAMGDHFSTNDPRAVLKHFKLKITPAIQWKKDRVGAEIRGIWGYGQQESQVDYRNKEYYESTQFPEYLNWLINGYGTMRNALSFSDRVYTNNQDFAGAGVSFFLYGRKLSLQANTTYEKIHEEYDRGNSSGRYDGYDMYGDYDVHVWKGFLELRDTALTWGALLQAEQHRGKDYNIDLLGNNYAYLHRKMAMQLYYRTKLWNRNTQFILDQSFRYTTQVDGNMLLERSRGRQQTYLRMFHSLNRQETLQLELGAGYSTPYSLHFSQSPRTSNDFIEEVVKHDVAFDQIRYWNGQIGLQQHFRFAGMKWMARIRTEHTQSTKENKALSGKSRNVSTASISLYF